MGRWTASFLALLGIMVMAVPIAIVGISILLFMGSPALFRQRRAGLGGLPFELVKFRSMRDDRDAAGCLLPDAERTTWLGKFLRRSRIDELPELWNILRGDMAFVGPRPLLPHTVAEMGIDGIMRSSVRPG